MIRRWLLLCLIALYAAAPLRAQSNPIRTEPFAWSAADLAFIAPSGWVAAGESADLGPAMTFTAPDGGRLRLIALPAPQDAKSLLAALQTATGSGSFAVTRYDPADWFGQPGLLGSGATAQAVAAKLPDGRGLLILGDGSAAEWVQPAAESVTFSARSAPTQPAYHVFWAEPLPDPVSFTDVTEPRLAGLVTLADGRLVAAEPARGLVFFQPGTPGAEVIPFPNPSQPTGLALNSAGRLVVSDPVCRCLQVYTPRGWDTPIGAFAGGAPHSVAAGPNGALYVVDGDASAYSLWVQDSAGERRIPLTFNAAAPPLLAAGGSAETPRLYVLEWLTSLMDGTVSVAVSDVRDDKLTLLGWLPVAPDDVRGAAVLPDGALAVALADGTMARLNVEDNTLGPLANVAPGVPRAMTASAEAALYVGLESGDVLGFQFDGPPGRTGDGRLQADVPAQARISDGWPAQTFTYAGRAGEVVTVNATDLLRQNTLDMALKLSPGRMALNWPAMMIRWAWTCTASMMRRSRPSPCPPMERIGSWCRRSQAKAW